MSVRIGMAPGLNANLSPAQYWRWVDFCEEAGVDSIWHSDQLLGPTLEPLTMLAALVARTSRMRIGTNALVLPFRDPVVLAKQFASIEFLGEGRLFPVLGVGAAGDPYWAATGSGSEGRGSRANEAIELLRLLLECEHVEFAGAHFRYQGPGVLPRPARRIPLWIGGNSPAALRRTALLGDGWLGSLIGPELAGAARRGIEAALAQAGRSIEADHYGVTLFLRIGAEGDPSLAQARDRLLERMKLFDRNTAADAFAVGTSDDVVRFIRQFVAQGMSKFVVAPMVQDGEDLLDQTQRLVRDVLPQIEN
jgi:probable F420-dependent oxidoreductase